MGLSTVLATVLDILMRESYSWEMSPPPATRHCHQSGQEAGLLEQTTERYQGNSPHPTHLQEYQPSGFGRIFLKENNLNKIKDTFPQ